MIAVASAQADQPLIQLSAWPSVCVADGRTPVDITAVVRDTSGRLVPDGTRVTFTTTLGAFRDVNVSTLGGAAHATLIAGNIAGVATITAMPSSSAGSPSVFTYEFVASRSELSSAREYVEIVAPGYMQYAHSDRLIGAAAPNQGVSLRYREIEIHADDLQYDINSYVVKARKARLRIGHMVKQFDELNITLNSRQGFGTTSYQRSYPETIAQQGSWLVFLSKLEDGSYGIAPLEDRYGLVQFHGELVTPFSGPLQPDAFKIADISMSPSTVSARRAVVFPRKEIQFQGAEIYVASTKIIRLPLFVINFNTSYSPMVTDGLVSINDNQIGINYPQYLMLKPGITSDLRFHMGDQYGRGYGSDRGAFLDYELNWNRGDDMEGGFTLGGIGRNDWSMNAHQYWRFDDRTNANAQFSLPSGTGFFGSGSIGHQFNGYSADINASHSQTFSGFRSSSQSYSADLASDSKRVGKLPIRYSYGLTATETTSDDQVFGRRQQAGQGLLARAVTDGIPLDKLSVLTASMTVNKLYGTNELHGFGLLGTVNLSRRVGKNANLLMTYNYTQDGFNDRELGRHMFSVQGSYNRGRMEWNVLGSKGLGVDRLSLYTDMSYRLGNLWRLAYSYTSDRVLGTEFVDYNLGLTYRLGWREVGVVWSERTHRLGLQLLGASF